MEEGVITDVNRKTWTVTVETRHTAKTVPDLQIMVPYHHYANGEGLHHLPEVGAVCLLGWPSDNTPPIVMGYLGMPSVELASDGQARPESTDDSASPTDVSLRSRRPDMNPGDIGMTTRDENFVICRRGGIVQIGATSIAQRIYIPVLNYIKDICENYSMQSFGGDVSWTVDRQESDPSGNAPATWTMHLREFAQDAKATVRVRYLPVQAPGGGSKSAWEISVSPQGIDTDDGSVEEEMYSLLVTIDGDKTEVIGANRSVTVRGNDTVRVEGNQETTVTGDSKITAQGSLEHIAGSTAVLGGAIVKLGSKTAAHPGTLGDELVQWLATSIWPVAGGAAAPSPASIAALSRILSTKVFLD